ncbi:type II toxin-antitoxin system HipA family toxin [Cellulomonas sp. S1-8]|uniref:type II toxin-antitoxin system HipA family toxin n=1 Tax=Cellulomonas sp. S1-8 TaxID=2904790 RepID=UPI002242E39B|nr:HipA domain-containing protein [Cellulomonas sp. S1-8]UZN03494.1 type II toxin-antitoxin system HipA family toxin [Cellulomonas sp. S1-8]
MTTSEPTTAYVWAWSEGALEPVVVGRIDVVPDSGGPDEQRHTFTYGRRYRDAPGAVPLYAPELPLVPGVIEPLGALRIAGVLGDGAPDAWGRRILEDRAGASGQLSTLEYLLGSGSDRIGALDFQESATTYVPRNVDPVPLEQLMTAAQYLEEGQELTPALSEALLRGTSVGGARPKALIEDDGRHLIAKFSSTTDTGPRVKEEGVAMDLARRVGLNVAPTQVITTAGHDVLLVERFDRAPGGGRRMMVSALTFLEEDDHFGHYLTYPELADKIRATFTDPVATLRELFSRIVLNVAVGNFDDHARNHAAFWDPATGTATLTPAYDIDPRPRSGEYAAQALAIGRGGERESKFAVCVNAAEVYLLDRAEAQDIVDEQVAIINAQWNEAADAALLTKRERERLWGTKIMNPFVFQAP